MILFAMSLPIATPATADTTYAYNAANSEELFKAFEAITSSITTGISSGTVTDPMGPNISVTNKPADFRTEDGKTYTWELANGEKSTDGSKTTYTYKLSYTVTLDTTGEGYVDTAVKIIIAVVIGALLMAGLVALFSPEDVDIKGFL